MKFLALFALLLASNVWADETPCTADQVKQNVVEYLKGLAHYSEEGQKITMENVKIGTAMPYPDFENPTSYYISATMKMDMTSPEGTISNENGIITFWFDASTCEDTRMDFDELKPVNLDN